MKWRSKADGSLVIYPRATLRFWLFGSRRRRVELKGRTIVKGAEQQGRDRPIELGWRVWLKWHFGHWVNGQPHGQADEAHTCFQGVFGSRRRRVEHKGRTIVKGAEQQGIVRPIELGWRVWLKWHFGHWINRQPHGQADETHTCFQGVPQL